MNNFEQCIRILERDFSHFASDLFPQTSGLIIQYYLETIDNLQLGDISKIVFVGGVGQNYKMLHKKIKEVYGVEIHVPILEESTLQGLGYLSSSIS